MASRSLQPTPNQTADAGLSSRSSRRQTSAGQGARLPLLRFTLPLLLAALPLPALLVACKAKPPEVPVVQGPRRISALGRLEPETRIRKVSVPTSLSGDRVQDILVEEASR